MNMPSGVTASMETLKSLQMELLKKRISALPSSSVTASAFQ